MSGLSIGHLTAIWQAECSKLFSRAPAKLGLLLAFALGISGPALLHMIGNSEIMVQGNPLSDTLQLDAPMGTQWALTFRNFFVLRAFIIVLGALSFAGELKASTLREHVLRPVPRWSILLAKWGALFIWIALTLGIPWITAALVGLVAFGTEGAWTTPALGYAATLLADTGFALLVLAISVVSRSVPMTIAGVFLFIVFDWLLDLLLSLLSIAGGFMELPAMVEVALQAEPWLPSAAFGVWQGIGENQDWIWQSFVALGVITALAWVVGERVFARMDVP